MRKPRDFDSEMKALNDRAKLLKERKLAQLGELVIATGADALPIDLLAGVLLAATEVKDAGIVEGWRKRGTAFFQRTARTSVGRNDLGAGSKQTDGSDAKAAAGEARA